MKALFYAAAGAAVLIAGAAEAHQAGARYNAAAGYRGPVVQSRAQTWYSDTGWQGGYGPIESYGYGYGYGGAGMRSPVVIAPSQPPIQHGGYSYAGVTRSMPFGYPVDGYGRYPWARGYGGQYQGGYHQQTYGHGGYAPDCGRCAPAPQYAPQYAPQPVHYRSEPIYVSQPPVYVSQPPVYVETPPIYVQPAPVFVEPARIHVAPPPVHVAAADVRVAPAQVEVARPYVHVEPPRVETAPPVVNFEQGYYAVPPPPPPPPSPTERPYRQERGERG